MAMAGCVISPLSIVVTTSVGNIVFTILFVVPAASHLHNEAHIALTYIVCGKQSADLSLSHSREFFLKYIVFVYAVYFLSVFLRNKIFCKYFIHYSRILWKRS